ncbi:hypothetical protein IH824_16295, partial [candidate division KSB1 bacterium]|nr:hypothetical protein [candidate division KSB1 bacterium]
NALTRQYQYLFEMEDVDLVFEDSALRAVAKKALDRKTGARGLRSILENVLLDTMYDLPSTKDIGTVTITEEVIRDNAKPVLAKQRLTKTAQKEDEPSVDLRSAREGQNKDVRTVVPQNQRVVKVTPGPVTTVESSFTSKAWGFDE